MSSAFPCSKWGRGFVFTGPKLINSSVRGCAPSVQTAALLWWVHLSHPRAKWGNALESWREGSFSWAVTPSDVKVSFIDCFLLLSSCDTFGTHRSFSNGRKWKHFTVLMGSSPFSAPTHTKAFSLSLRAPFLSLWFSQTSSLSSNTCKSFKGLTLFAQTFKLLCNN